LKMPPMTLQPEATTASSSTTKTVKRERVAINTSLTLAMLTSRHS
jgi:hypothetical protein